MSTTGGLWLVRVFNPSAPHLWFGLSAYLVAGTIFLSLPIYSPHFAQQRQTFQHYQNLRIRPDYFLVHWQVRTNIMYATLDWSQQSSFIYDGHSFLNIIMSVNQKFKRKKQRKNPLMNCLLTNNDKSEEAKLPRSFVFPNPFPLLPLAGHLTPSPISSLSQSLSVLPEQGNLPHFPFLSLSFFSLLLSFVCGLYKFEFFFTYYILGSSQLPDQFKETVKLDSS